MSRALPISSRPQLEHYQKLAEDHQQACRQRGEECELIAAQFFVAREHGFANWAEFSAHVEALSLERSPTATFELAADAVIAGDMASLQPLLNRYPDLIRQRSTREHRSTLLHYVSANGVEDFRQRTPANILEITSLLLDAGADVNAASEAYGGGATTLGLVATSVHPERAGVQIDLMNLLLERGAHMHEGIIASCLWNGQPGAAAYLATRGAPINFSEAAGLGMLEAVRKGYPEATRQQVENAFRVACGYGRAQVVQFFIESGIDLEPGERWM